MPKMFIKDARLSYAQQLYEAGQYEGKGDFYWNCHLILDPVQHAKEIAEIERIEKETFREKCKPKDDADFEKKWAAIPQKDRALRDGDLKDGSEGYEGKFFLAPRATVGKHAKPLVIDRRRQIVTAGAAGAPYGGCFVNAEVELWAQYGTYKGTRSTLMVVQFNRDGDAFGGGAPPNLDRFQDLGDQGEDSEGDDDTGGLI